MIRILIKIIACFACLFSITSLRAVEYSATPIDFGSATYNVAGGGFSVILVSSTGLIGTSGSGNLFNRSGGAAGNYAFSNWDALEYRLFLDILDPFVGSYTVSTPGCGTVTIEDIELMGGQVSVELDRHWHLPSYVLDVPLGATLSLDSFEGTAACTISGVAPGVLHYVTKTTDLIVRQEGYLDIPIQLYVVPTMSLEHDEDAVLNFGRICASQNTQSITVWPDGTVSTSNFYCNPQDTAPDSFAVHGVTHTPFTVNLPASATITNGEDTLTLSNFFSSCSNTTCTIESGTTQHFNVGATLTIPPNPSVGIYTGEYQVSVTY